MIASSLLGVVAQRLVRTICPHCVEDIVVAGDVLRGYGFPVEGDGEVALKRGKGCRQCRHTGYLGRCAIFEVFGVTDKIRSLISNGADEDALRQAAGAEGMTSLRDDLWRKIQEGITTCDEALRIVGGGAG